MKQLGFATAIWTNNDRVVADFVLARFGLLAHLDLVVTRDEMRAAQARSRRPARGARALARRRPASWSSATPGWTGSPPQAGRRALHRLPRRTRPRWSSAASVDRGADPLAARPARRAGVATPARRRSPQPALSPRGEGEAGIIRAWTSSTRRRPPRPRRPRRSPTACGRARSTRWSASAAARPGQGRCAAALEQGALHSMILWGPPGTGKTTLARLMADVAGARFVPFSAVLSGVKEIRQVIAEAEAEGARGAGAARSCSSTRSTASTAPSRTPSCPTSRGAPSCWSAPPPRTRRSRSTRALLSRCRVYVLRPLGEADLVTILERALADARARARRPRRRPSSRTALALIARLADGDARSALNMLELAVR